jgi:hypothetical protein
MEITRRAFVRNASLATPAMVLPQICRCGFIPSLESGTESQPIFYDKDGLIVHKGLDGGDTAQREGWYWLGVWIRENVLKDPWTVPRSLTFLEVLRLLEPKSDGVFYRHPKLPPWNNPYDKDWGFSRDQMIPLVAAMGVWGFTEPLRRLWNALPQDVVGGTKHTFNGNWVTVFGKKTVYTGDDVRPGIINLFRRSWGENPMTASDHNGPSGEEDLRGNAVLRCPPLLSDRDNTGNDLNLIVMLLMAILRFPTPVSTKAANFYAKNRVVSYGSFLGAYRQKYGEMTTWDGDVRRRFDEGIAAGWKTDSSRVFGAVRWYQRAQTGANPRLAELYAPIIHAYLE